MPKLDRNTAVAVNKAEAGGQFVLLDEGEYLLKLTGVKVSPKTDKNDNHYWIWSFDVVQGPGDETKFKGKKISSNTGLAENQHWFLKMFFDAFGAKPNVDTDTLIGDEVSAIISQGEITTGARKGKLRSQIDSLAPKDAFMGGSGGEDGDWDAEDGESEDDPDF